MGLGASFCWQHWQNRTRPLLCMKCAFHGHEWIYRNGIVEPANLSIYRISYSIERRFKCSGSIEAIQPYCLSEMHLKHSWWCEWQTVTIQNHGVVHVVFRALTHWQGHISLESTNTYTSLGCLGHLRELVSFSLHCFKSVETPVFHTSQLGQSIRLKLELVPIFLRSLADLFSANYWVG